MLDNLPVPAPLANLGHVNLRYEPWGGNPSAASTSSTANDLRVKDPLLLQSDYWDFPTNKLPNIGWLGRVHRGTPWQTVYLKSPPIDFPTWRVWTGNGQIVTNLGQFPTNLLSLYVPGTTIGLANDAILTQPTNDWRLVDMFTTALSDNATRGQLSINEPQPNLAAWSAVLSGVIALTNSLDANGNRVLSAQVVQPAGVFNLSDPTTWSPVVQLVKRINDVRATNSTRHVFSRLGDLLAVPEFSVSSPFLNTNGTATLANSALNDAAYERLPQQILGLLEMRSIRRASSSTPSGKPSSRLPMALSPAARSPACVPTTRSWPKLPRAPSSDSRAFNLSPSAPCRRQLPGSIPSSRVSTPCHQTDAMPSLLAPDLNPNPYLSGGSNPIGANLMREAFGVRGIPALSRANRTGHGHWLTCVHSGGIRRTPNAARTRLALMGISPPTAALVAPSLLHSIAPLL